MSLSDSKTLIAFLMLLIIASTCVYLYFDYKFSYWRRRGVKYLAPSIPFGNFGPTLRMTKHMGLMACELYRRTTEPFIGIFIAVRPVLLLCDPVIIRQILIKDFQYFNSRGAYYDEQHDPLSVHLFSLDGDRWENLRRKLSPAFTPGRLKEMFPTFVACGAPLQRLLADVASKGETIEIREIVARFLTDVFASVAFGVEVNSIDDPNVPFRRFGRKYFDTNIRNGLRFMGIFLFPIVLKMFRLRWMDTDFEQYMLALVKDTLEYREKNNIVRKDFFQLLIQLRNTGAVQSDDQWESNITTNEKRETLNLTEMVANAFIFYGGGFETSSTTSSYFMFEMARHPKIQQKVHEEIDRVLATHDGQLTYESLAEMTYLENCIDETLRKHAPAPLTNRECSMDYHVPGTNIVIEKGTYVLVPILGLHRDERYHSNPMEFNPDRFNDRNAMGATTYFPFSEGQRICIGMRFAKIQLKIVICFIMQRYRYELADAEYYDKELPVSTSSLTLIPACGINLKIHSR